MYVNCLTMLTIFGIILTKGKIIIIIIERRQKMTFFLFSAKLDNFHYQHIHSTELIPSFSFVFKEKLLTCLHEGKISDKFYKCER